MFRLLGTCCFAVIASLTVTHAQEGLPGPENPRYVGREEAVGLVRSVYLALEDQATGKCWTNIRRSNNKARLLLKQNNIPVFTEPFATYTVFSPAVQVLIVATRSESGFCIGKISVTVYHSSEQPYGEGKEYLVSTLGQLWGRSAIMGNGSNLNEQILDWIDAMMTEYTADVLEKRQESVVKQMLADFPNSGLNPMTLVEWNQLMKKSR